MRTLKDYNTLIESAKLAKKLTTNRASFKKKLSAFLAEKGNEFKLWVALSVLSEYGIELLNSKVELVKRENDNANSNLPN